MNNRQSLKSLLQNKDFILMQFGLTVSRIGTFMQDVAVNWQLYQLTRSPISLGIVGLAKFLPVLICSFFAGIIADTFNRKKVIFLVETIAILNSSILAYLTFTGKITPLLIYIFVGLDAGLYSFESPARQAMGPTIVKKEDYPLAVNIMNIFYQSTQFVGPALSGFVIAFWEVKTVYVVNALSFAAVLVALVFMNPLPKNTKRPNFGLKEIGEGLKFVFKTPLIASSMYIDFFAQFFGSSLTLLPIFAVKILKLGPAAMGFLYAAPAVGAIIAGMIFPFFSKIKERGKLLFGGILLYGVSIVFFGLSKNFYLSLILLALSGAGDVVSVIIRNVIRQLNTPDYIRGRMTAVNMAFYTGGPELGEVEAGFTANLLGTPYSVAIGGLATIAVTLLIAKKTPELLNYTDSV